MEEATFKMAITGHAPVDYPYVFRFRCCGENFVVHREPKLYGVHDPKADFVTSHEATGMRLRFPASKSIDSQVIDISNLMRGREAELKASIKKAKESSGTIDPLSLIEGD